MDFGMLMRLRPLSCRLLKPGATDSSTKTARMALLNSQAVREHFVELTIAMLTPFAPYCEPTGPQPDEAPAPGQERPQLPAFSHAEFIEQLQRQPLPPVLQQRFRSQARAYSCTSAPRSCLLCA